MSGNREPHSVYPPSRNHTSREQTVSLAALPLKSHILFLPASHLLQEEGEKEVVIYTRRHHNDSGILMNKFYV